MVTQKRDVPANTGSGGGRFLKIEIGQSANGVFRGQPVSYWQKWPKGGNKETSDIPKPGFEERFKVNFIIHEEGAFVAKILDMNLALYNQMAEVNEAYDVETIKCKISRQPAGKGSIYLLLPLLKKDDAIPAKTLAAIEAVELLPLGPAPAQAPKNHAPGASDPDEVPF
jgi:hypothetical protein